MIAKTIANYSLNSFVFTYIAGARLKIKLQWNLYFKLNLKLE